jgi:hypothetical protein
MALPSAKAAPIDDLSLRGWARRLWRDHDAAAQYRLLGTMRDGRVS